MGHSEVVFDRSHHDIYDVMQAGCCYDSEVVLAAEIGEMTLLENGCPLKGPATFQSQNNRIAVRES